MKISPVAIAAFLLAPSLLVAAPVDYIREVKPLLQATCVKCHGTHTQKSDLRLDTVANALKGGVSGPSIVPGKASESLLILSLDGKHEYIPKMPYKPAAARRRAGRSAQALDR